MEWKTIAEDSAKKAKTQRRRQEIPSLSAMTQLDVDVLWFGVTRKSGNEHIDGWFKIPANRTSSKSTLSSV